MEIWYIHDDDLYQDFDISTFERDTKRVTGKQIQATPSREC